MEAVLAAVYMCVCAFLVIVLPTEINFNCSDLARRIKIKQVHWTDIYIYNTHIQNYCRRCWHTDGDDDLCRKATYAQWYIYFIFLKSKQQQKFGRLR